MAARSSRRNSFSSQEVLDASSLVGRVMELALTHDQSWMQHLAQGLAGLCDVPVVFASYVVNAHPVVEPDLASVRASGTARTNEPPKQPRRDQLSGRIIPEVSIERAAIHGLRPDELQRFFDYLADPLATDPMLDRYSVLDGSVRTRDRRELVDDHDWYRSRFVHDYKRVGGCDHCAYTTVSLGPESPSALFGFGLHTRWGDKPVPQRKVQLAEAVAIAIRPLAMRMHATHRAAALQLSARQRQVLDCFIRGDSEKEAARQIGISVHAVHYHAKALYRLLGVHTRAELAARHGGLRSPEDKRT
ncbi:MAG: helix-turn-helix transcriptional regulator [Planctomycetota bacterium]|nr:helix-turn-helix transcriptional regulator [Planctomycetota bacterium]